jgi:thioredoxin reductase (NADPH)
VGLYGDNGVEGMNVVHKKGTEQEELEAIPIDGFFLAIGHTPNTRIFAEYLTLDEQGYIVTQPNTSLTNIDGVFAAGDVCDTRYRQAITAAGSGCKAAIDAERYLAAKH